MDSHVLLRASAEPIALAVDLLVRPADLAAVVVAGHTVVRDGEPVDPPGPRDLVERSRLVGAWYDDSSRLVQHLLPSGRYTETRSGRVDAWTGRWWVAGDWVVYLDDTSFWAFGQLVGDRLHHAGFVMDRRLG